MGPELFVITGQVFTSRSHSFLILTGWWSERLNDYSKILIAAGRARQHYQQFKEEYKERGDRSGSGGFSEYSKGFYPLPERGSKIVAQGAALFASQILDRYA
jgi:hypothetical protein